jgi:hypothetical protein
MEENKLQANTEQPTTQTLSIVDDNYDMRVILDSLKEEDAQEVLALRAELTDNWVKKQIFRTETEMRISVLNDFKHPTPASKYWQSVREMSAHFDGLMGLSFDLRKNKVERMRLERKLQEAIETGDDLDVMDIQIDLDQNMFARANMEQTAHDRVRELKLWSKIKSELDDGSFDAQDVNQHQAESYRHALINRVNALGPNAHNAEVVNALGPLKTVERLRTPEGKLLTFEQARLQLTQGQQPTGEQ